MTQRVRRAERLKRQRGFVYRRPLADFNGVLRAVCPMHGRPAQDWPSAATVTVEMVVGVGRTRRLELFEVRVKVSGSSAEASRRALAKLRRETWSAGVVRVKPDGVPSVPPLRSVTYRGDPFFRMLKVEANHG